jgi:hypothetical protein
VVTIGTFGASHRRVSTALLGAPLGRFDERMSVRLLKSALFRWSGRHTGEAALQWWEYFGSFGDDCFTEDD